MLGMKYKEPDFISFSARNGSSAIACVSFAQFLSISLLNLRPLAQ
jgi:hypothetical protein